MENNYFNYDYSQNPTMKDYESLLDNTNAITRYLNPNEGEYSAFLRENMMMDKQNAASQHFWELNNAYNTPAMQMERMKTAGINPLLAATGIAGGQGNTATAATGASGSAGGIAAATNPLDIPLKAIEMATTGISGANELGEILGFGEKNKAEIDKLTKEAKSTLENTKLTEKQRELLKRQIPDLVDLTKQEVEEKKQNIANLKELNDNYKAERKKIEAETQLTETQNTTEEERKRLTDLQADNEELKKWELEFKKQFREIFGIQLNESDTSMLIEAVLNGQGDAIIDAIGNMMKTIGENIIKTPAKILTNPIKNRKEAKRAKIIQEIFDTYGREKGKKILKEYDNLPKNLKKRYKNPLDYAKDHHSFSWDKN